MLLQAADKGSAQVMDCLNTANVTKGNLGKKRRAVGQKPTSLESANMKKPMPVASASVEDKENAAVNIKVNAAPAAAVQDNDDSSEPDFDCLACGSWSNTHTHTL